MEKDTNKNRNTNDGHQAMPADAKPTYQPPVIMPLGKLARGWGQGQCFHGPTANGQCGNGGNAHGGCQPGATANNCNLGSGDF